MTLKRSTRRRLRDGTLYAVLAAVVLLVVLRANRDAISANFLDKDTWKELWPDIILTAAKNTVKYTVTAFAGGILLALVLALMKLSPLRLYRWLATAYIEFFRGLPALVVIIFMALGVPLAFGWIPPGGTIGAGIIALILVSGAYMAETLRAGIQAVPKGQHEAARSLGMNGLWTMVTVILPQAVRIVIPPLTNEFILLVKDTSLLAIVGMQANQVELTSFGQNGLTTYANASPLLAIALVYLVISIPATQLVAHLERRQQRASR
ncbi:polar amino acid transport system permease protein [Nocardioides ginsengisegetis]|uniref:Polar amino acid transport system permease protein n=1 Tax=Nocardioides ginsengisegetis TaxID=661491 RepID=A0A7W3J063_9ACTN|nr:amino acid ABC transporter permease [Nocardioides sp. LS1]MBA8803853.1 polar amino acid transport system permease protein [Nocardioides ginsengisegetis]GCD89478.1 amino acid ABC transporter permease [Nocardioides sp. LS1]